MTQGLIHTLCEFALGNPRVLLNSAGELLHAAAQRGAPHFDEKPYLEVHGTSSPSPVVTA